MDSFKTYLIEVVLKKFVPSAVKGVLAWGVGYMVAHAEMLQQMGVVYVPTTRDIVVHLEVFSPWAGAAIVGVLMGLFTLLQHHSTAKIKGQPQDGSHARSTDEKEIK